MKQSDQYYFDNFVASAECACLAANYLVECLQNYRPERIEEMLSTMHRYEHQGDTKKHELSAALAKAFVTPIDREDLELVSRNIDDVTDHIEEVLQRFYVDHVAAVTPDAILFAQKLVSCCELVKNLLSEFSNFKKSGRLHQMIVELNCYEEECDALYLEATRKLRDRFDDVLTIISWREIYDKLECCADACEHVGDCVDLVIMKNT